MTKSIRQRLFETIEPSVRTNTETLMKEKYLRKVENTESLPKKKKKNAKLYQL